MVDQNVCKKMYPHGCMVWIGKSVTRDHCLASLSASLVMPISDPRDRFFYPHHTPMKDAYNLTLISKALLSMKYFVLTFEISEKGGINFS